MGLSGLEPPTSRLSGVRSNRLSYKPLQMPATGIEPVLYHYNRILSPARLPVPPRGLIMISHNKKLPHSFIHECFHLNGTYRARTCDPLLVRQMLSQLS